MDKQETYYLEGATFNIIEGWNLGSPSLYRNKKVLLKGQPYIIKTAPMLVTGDTQLGDLSFTLN